MKTLRRLCATYLLSLVFVLPVFAGEMSAGVTAPPPPPDSQMTIQGQISTSITGTMSTGVTGDMPGGITATDPATEALLNLLQSLLSLF